ncbi:hypothetical protein, conserved [Leishmania tarentolae]|uniref:Soluble NSF attachment protein, SNAP family protein n=1 Tax=Leishmania tarentolae TaxID=5689 RepID=A0A640K8Z1_LEITA|nr:hypothetical protein, conserved [Leishmania tarentolae]
MSSAALPPEPQQAQQSMQLVLAAVRQQGWGGASPGGGNAMCTGVSSSEMEMHSGSKYTCLKIQEAPSAVTSPPFKCDSADECFSSAADVPFAAVAATPVVTGAPEADKDLCGTMQPPMDSQQLSDSKGECAPTARANAVASTMYNTNGVCEAIVTAARYGGMVAPGTSVPAAAHTATSGNVIVTEEEELRRSSGPFGSYSTTDEALQQKCCDVPQAGELNCTNIPTAASSGVLMVPSANTLVPACLSGAPSSTGAEMQQLLAEAHRAYTAAEEALLNDGLALREDWMGTRDLFFAAGSLFAAVGEAAAAARCLLHATFINRAFQNDNEALTTLSMAVEQLKQSHPRIAVDSLLRLAPCYAKQELRYQAARCYRDAAEILENVLEAREEAVVQYRAALDMYAESQAAATQTARCWKREQQRRCTAAICGEFSGTPALPHSTGASTPNEDMASASVADGADSTSPESEQLLVSPSSTALAPSRGGASVTSSVGERKSNPVAFAAHGPPAYLVSTTVQRTLSDSCRWRLMILLTRLGRYEEARETALACAEHVPRTLPKTKYLLYATLCVLARGASVNVDGVTSTACDLATAAEAANASETPAMSFTTCAADTVYFDSLYDTEKFFLRLQDEDRNFQRGKENALVRGLLAANRACSLTAFDDAVRTYQNYSTTEPCVAFELLVGECRRSLYEHMERFA